MRGDCKQFFAEWPDGWRELLGNIAYTFKFQPSELAEFDLEDLLFWGNQYSRIMKEIKGSGDT
jgi:hypothetical protein